MAETILFEEKQHMREPLIWASLLVIGVISLLTGIGVVVPIAIAVVLYSVQLTTEVREDGVYVRFGPFPRSYHKILFSEIEKCDIEKVGMMTGGLGVRWSSGVSAYTTNRGEGVKLSLKSGNPVIIGSRSAEQLSSVIEEEI
ncbi:DUF6141 family protein [Halococcus sp. IIIV-5B]|uniref:DUF6141 family protein n=1 Tax=Halococcus sp. IIIV-5B TaxID=2321230 RepID=UPI0011C405F6|nr:DUF6141 family protein [Halococcus sp. IIIV-5B]